MFTDWEWYDYVAWVFAIGVIVYILSFFAPIFAYYFMVLPVVKR